jgi:hypothetical protein
VRRPLLEGRTGVELFHLDDDAYVAWRAAHPDGFVLNDSLGAGHSCRLHRTACSYLTRAVAEADAPRTRQPKWCADELALLEGLLPGAVSCGRCRPGGRA